MVKTHTKDHEVGALYNRFQKEDEKYNIDLVLNERARKKGEKKEVEYLCQFQDGSMRWLKLTKKEPAFKLWKKNKKAQNNIDFMNAELNPEWLYEKYEKV